MVSLKWSGKGIQFIAQDEQGHEVIVDTVKELGGLDQGFAPMNLLLVSLAGCMAMDIMSIVRKKGAQLSSLVVKIEGEKNPTHPKRFIKIRYEIRAGGDYRREDLLRAFELSRDKYCSVLATIGNPPEFEYSI